MVARDMPGRQGSEPADRATSAAAKARPSSTRSGAQRTATGSAASSSGAQRPTAAPEATLAAAAASVMSELRGQLPAGMEDIAADPKELRRIAYRGQAHRYNKKDVFGIVGKTLGELRRHITTWPNPVFRQKYAISM